jgi:glutamate formiminotransferase
VVECVPNFSEGRDEAVIAALSDAAASVPGVAVLDLHRDPWHHRSVLTLAGSPGAVSEAAFRTVSAAADRIDLRGHRGEHPRIGAADVVPFVPLEGLDLGHRTGGDMEDCVAAARETGRRIARELEIPVFLYGAAALRPDREVPASFRTGGFEALRDSIGSEPRVTPDFGPGRVHPTAGATAVGARGILVAYNVLLETDDPEPAREIAREIRASGGGLPAVQALGFLVEGRAQVSTNLLDVDRTRPLEVFEAVRERAAARGIGVRGSEIVGLLPRRALPPAAEESLGLREPADGKVLEERIREELGG